MSDLVNVHDRRDIAIFAQQIGTAAVTRFDGEMITAKRYVLEQRRQRAASEAIYRAIVEGS